MNSVHNEIVIWSSLHDPDIREKGRGIQWICLWNNYSKPLKSHITHTSPYGSKDVDSIVIDRLQRDVIEWRHQRTHQMRFPSSSSRSLQSSIILDANNSSYVDVLTAIISFLGLIVLITWTLLRFYLRSSKHLTPRH